MGNGVVQTPDFIHLVSNQFLGKALFVIIKP